MGGNTFTDTQPITVEEYVELECVLMTELEVIGCERMICIGSTGKVEVMGDVDIAVEHPYGRAPIVDHFIQLYGRHNVKQAGSRQLSINYPYGTKRFQLDIVVGPPGSSDWLWWSHHSPGMASPIKGVVRNLLLNTISRELSNVNGNERTRLLIDWDIGVYQVLQVLQFGDDWKTLHKDFVTSDPNVLINRLFSVEYSARDVVTFEDVVKALKTTSSRATEILKVFFDEVKELSSKRPHLFGDITTTLTYVEQACLP